MTADTGPVGVYQVIPRQPIETLFKDSYFVSGSGMAKCFKDSSLDFGRIRSCVLEIDSEGHNSYICFRGQMVKKLRWN